MTIVPLIKHTTGTVCLPVCWRVRPRPLRSRDVFPLPTGGLARSTTLTSLCFRRCSSRTVESPRRKPHGLFFLISQNVFVYREVTWERQHKYLWQVGLSDLLGWCTHSIDKHNCRALRRGRSAPTNPRDWDRNRPGARARRGPWTESSRSSGWPCAVIGAASGFSLWRVIASTDMDRWSPRKKKNEDVGN